MPALLPLSWLGDLVPQLNRLQKKVGTLMLTSLLEDPADVSQIHQYRMNLNNSLLPEFMNFKHFVGRQLQW